MRIHGSTSTAYAVTLAMRLGNPVAILHITAAVAAGAVRPLVVVGVFVGSAVW